MMPSKTKYACEIRKAAKKDAPQIAKILSIFAKKKILLPRTAHDIRENIRNFWVSENSRKNVIACCALRHFGSNLYEIRSLAVLKRYNGKGLGSKLVLGAINSIHGKGEIFALTYKSDFFARLGFKIVSKEMFPEKIWHDCNKCPKKDNCDETAVLLEK
jgi:amino-acid N-acetyltransferase